MRRPATSMETSLFTEVVASGLNLVSIGLILVLGVFLNVTSGMVLSFDKVLAVMTLCLGFGNCWLVEAGAFFFSGLFSPWFTEASLT